MRYAVVAVGFFGLFHRICSGAVLPDGEGSHGQRWRWGLSSERLVFRYLSVPVVTLTPPDGFFFVDETKSGNLLNVRLAGTEGYGTWTIGWTDKRLNVYARHVFNSPILGATSWLWIGLPANLFQGALSLPTVSHWQGETCFGRIRLFVEGLSAQCRWRKLGSWLFSELFFPSGIREVTGHFSLELPERWLEVATASGPAIIRSLDIAVGDPWGRPLVPAPKWIRTDGDPFRLGREVSIYYLGDGFQKIGENLAQYLTAQWGRDVRILYGVKHPSDRGIMIGPKDHPRVSAAYPSLADAAGRLPPQGFYLQSDPNGIYLLASDPKGASYGVRCLEQLFSVTNEGGLIVPGVKIRDWPDLTFRGIHIVVDDYSPHLHGRLLTRVLYRLRYNAVVVQVDHLEWKSQPDLKMPWSLPQAEAVGLFRLAENLGFEVIPLLPTLSHCEYLFGSNRNQVPRVNRQIAEEPTSSYLYCPSRDQTYQVVFSLLSELLSIWSFRRVHIGHDEVTRFGTFGTCRLCRQTAPRILFANDVIRLYQFWKEKGKEVMMWGDMLLLPEEAPDSAHGGPPENVYLARALIPKDITIFDWHYQPAQQYPSLFVFKRVGFPVIGSSWRNRLNILGLSRACRDSGALGMCQTTWTGFGSNRSALSDHPDQMAAYVAAGQAMWDSSFRIASSSPSHWDLFDKMLSWPTRPALSGSVLDLTDCATLTLRALLRLPSLRLPERLMWDGTILWMPTDPLGNTTALVTGGHWIPNAPRHVAIPVGQPAGEIAIIHGCAFPVSPGTLVARYRFLSPSARLSRNLIYGVNIRALSDPGPLTDPAAKTVWSAATQRGTLSLYGCRVSLKQPVFVNAIELTSLNDEASPFIVTATVAYSATGDRNSQL